MSLPINIVTGKNHSKRTKIINDLYENMTEEQKQIVYGKTYNSWTELEEDLFHERYEYVDNDRALRRIKREISKNAQAESPSLGDEEFEILEKHFMEGGKRRKTRRRKLRKTNKK